MDREVLLQVWRLNPTKALHLQYVVASKVSMSVKLWPVDGRIERLGEVHPVFNHLGLEVILIPFPHISLLRTSHMAPSRL